jgi:hypothetical protein
LLFEVDLSMVDLCTGYSEILWWPPRVMFDCLCFKVQGQIIYPLEGDPVNWNPPIWLWSRGPSDDFLAKTLGVDVPLFLLNTELYFTLFSLLVRKLYKSRCTYVVSDSSVRSVFAYCMGRWVWIPVRWFFLIIMAIMALEAANYIYFIYFSIYSRLRMRGLQLVSQCEMLKIYSFPSRQLQVGSKISRRNTRSDRDTWRNVLAVRTVQMFKKELKLLICFKYR